MKKLIAALLVLTFSFTALADCKAHLQYTKKRSYFEKLDGDTQDSVIGVSSVTGFFVGIGVASAAFPAFLIAAGIATSPILVGEAIKGIQNRPINRMIKLIKQSENYAANPESKPGRLLKVLHRRIGEEFSLEAIAKAIVAANKDPKSCGTLDRFAHLDDEISRGTIPVIDLDADAELEGITE